MKTIYIFSSPEPKAHRWAYSIAVVRPSSSVVVRRRRQRFQTTFPLKPWSRFLPYFTYSIYRQGERIILFFFLSQSDKNFGCYGNFLLPLTYNGKKWKLAFTAVSLQIFWQKFYRNVHWVVLYKTYLFCCNLLICLVTMATQRQNLRKKNIK